MCRQLGREHSSGPYVSALDLLGDRRPGYGIVEMVVFEGQVARDPAHGPRRVIHATLPRDVERRISWPLWVSRTVFVGVPCNVARYDYVSAVMVASCVSSSKSACRETFPTGSGAGKSI